jgi:hypothetical protein
VVIEWKKGKEGGGQEWGTGESDKDREIVYGLEESINECTIKLISRRFPGHHCCCYHRLASITKLSISWSITMSFRVFSSSTLMTCLQ